MTIFPSGYRWKVEQTGLFNLCMATSLGEKKTELKLVIDMVKDGFHQSIPAQDTLDEQHPHDQTTLQNQWRVKNAQLSNLYDKAMMSSQFSTKFKRKKNRWEAFEPDGSHVCTLVIFPF